MVEVPFEHISKVLPTIHRRTAILEIAIALPGDGWSLP
jgi:hypothetical protein